MKFTSILALAVLAASAVTVRADVLGPAQSLDTLLDDGSIQVGDKIFTNFSYNATGDMPGADRVNVIPITDADGNFGLRFEGGWHDVAGGGSSDALITYDVSVAPGSDFLISDAHIAGDPAVVGTGLMQVAETWSPEADPSKILIYDAKPGDTQLLDSVDFNPKTFTTLHVQKDILADAGTDGAAFMSFVDQTYSQIPSTGVPEPASLGLLTLGATALLARRRRNA